MTEHPDVALVREWWEASAQDPKAAEPMMSIDVVHHVMGDNPLSGHYKGRDAVVELYRRLGSELENMEIRRTALLADGHGRVISVLRHHFERRGRVFEGQEALLFTISQGKIIEIEEFAEDLTAADEFWSP